MNTKNTKLSALVSDLTEFKHDPRKMLRSVFDSLNQVLDNKEVVMSANNPMVFLLESGVAITSSFINQDVDLTRMQYPSSAITQDDLYQHMCDKDYIDRFALPSFGKFTFIFDRDEIVSKMRHDPRLDVEKIVIPRNTYITVNTGSNNHIVFCLEYPIEIRKLKHGGMQIVFDTEHTSPIQTLDTNILDFKIIKDNVLDHDRHNYFIVFEVPMVQCRVISNEYSGTGNSFLQSISFRDKFYYARVWYQTMGPDNELTWVEMKTTHSPDIYDIADPTAVLKVIDKELQVYIPYIYSQMGLLSRKVRVDLYETKGELNINLERLPENQYAITWYSLDPKRDRSKEYSMLGNITLSTISVFSRDRVYGGRDELSFTELRSRVIENSTGIRDTPISNVQIENYLEDGGFLLVKNIDNVTNRSYLATKSLPKPDNDNILTSASASMETLSIKKDQLEKSGFVYKNYKSYTISPSAVYELKNNTLSMLTADQVQRIKDLDVDKRVEHINRNQYLSSPFHYVVDMDGKSVELRPYYLDEPMAMNKSFVVSNETTSLYQIKTTGYLFERTLRGYRLVITTETLEDDVLADAVIRVQLAFIPPKETEYAFITGNEIHRDKNIRMYEFHINTNYHVDKNDCIELTSFSMHNIKQRIVKAELDSYFDIVFSTDDLVGKNWVTSKLDKKFGNKFIPRESKILVNERIQLRFGYSLRNLWRRCRAISSAEIYQKHNYDVPLVYEEDVYGVHESTGTPVYLDDQGEIQVVYKHRKGDPVLDNNNQPIYKHRKGDIVIDRSGNPVIQDKRDIILQMDLMLVEWVYKLATHPENKKYYNEMVGIFVEWITDSLKGMEDRTLEQTYIYFYPRATLGTVEVMYNEGIVKKIHAGQSLDVELVVRPVIYVNLEIRDKITRTTVKLLNQLMQDNELSVSNMLSELVKVYGEDVIGVRIKGLGSDDDIITMTILDEAKRCSLRKKLVIESNNLLFIREDVDVIFIEHSRKE